MTRFFYTDPLAAIWMAKHFGMRIHAPVIKGNGDYGESDRPLPVWCWARKIEHTETDRDFIKERYYIHPDSIPLLEPQVGDILHRTNGYCQTVGVHIGIPKATAQIAAGGVMIQRSGKAFIWPEEEAA